MTKVTIAVAPRSYYRSSKTMNSNANPSDQVINEAAKLYRVSKRVREDEQRERNQVRSQCQRSVERCEFCNSAEHRTRLCEAPGLTIDRRWEIVYNKRMCSVCGKVNVRHLPVECFMIANAKEDIGVDSFGKAIWRRNPKLVLCRNETCHFEGNTHMELLCREVQRTELWRRYENARQQAQPAAAEE